MESIMDKMLHGGEIYGKNIRCDFSVNINPLGLPQTVRESLIRGMDALEHYPDRNCSALREAISGKEEISADWILCGNGASDLFQLITTALRPEKALVTAPAFSGYETALAGTGVRPDYLELRKEEKFCVTDRIFSKLEQQPDLVFLCNPNNPVGNCVKPELLQKIAEYCRKHHIYLVLDECFLGFLPDAEQRSMKPFLENNPYLLLISAFTKLYAMPGLRLGYLLSSNQELMQKMKQRQTEWSVSVPAQQAGIAALAEEHYVEEARILVQEENVYLTAELEKLGFCVYPSCADYLLFETENEIFTELMQRGILIRHCDNYHGLNQNFYRIALKRHADNRKLIAELTDIREKAGNLWKTI